MRFWVNIQVGAAVLAAFFGAAAHSQTPAPAAADGAQEPVASDAGSRPHDNTFVIGVDDVLVVSVWKEPDASRTVPVRSDGKISLPLAGEITAAGLTPLQLEQEIVQGLKNYISDPQVTVIVQQINSRKYNILGQVAKPGAYSLTASTTVVDAIAAAGGFKDFAKKKGIYILRKDGSGVESRIPFNYQDFIKGKSTSKNINIQPHDTIIVP